VRTSAPKDNGEIDASYFSELAATEAIGNKMESSINPHVAPANDERGGKEEHINLRIAAADKRAIEGKAERAGLSVADYMRRAALGRTIVERVPPDLRRQLGTASSNLNQLAKLANAGKLPGVGVEEINDLVARLRQTLK
jgi:predicted DNA binding CopG/RHH family protein